jgi:predicted ATPase/transcriptional regulator with XRE-family HTH domain
MPRTLVFRPENFATFGKLLRFLRRKSGLTQRELAIAVGYSESQISRLEKDERAPDNATLAARFVPALDLEEQPEWVARFLELGSSTHSPSGEPDTPSTSEGPGPALHNLPIQLTNFFGREKELKEIKRVFTANPSDEGNIRLLTLSGHGGCGKTRLALQAAFGLLDVFPDGIWLVEFAPLTDSDLVTNTLAAVLGITEDVNGELSHAITDHLRGKKLLLIFDNCEHVVQASAELAETLLQASSTLFILATSREMLGVSGERAIYVPSLSMPDRRHPALPGQLGKFESVQLFVDRAANVIPGFSLNQTNETAVAQICQRLDGIPLAIELAAARLRMLPVEQIATRLDDIFRLLTGGSRTALPRHQTLQALIDWSYDLLTEPEKILFRRLSVFARSWTLEACEAICIGEGVESSEILELLGHLIEKSLALKRSRVVGRALRYRLLDTIRQYANTRLIESGEADVIRRRHAEYYFNLAEAGAPRALNDYSQKNWLENMEIEVNNIRAAVTWSLSTMTNDAVELRLNRDGGIRVSAWALNRLGWLARERGDTITARAWLEQSLSIYRELDDKLGISWTTVTLGEVLNMQGHLETAKTMIEEGLTLARQQEESQAIGWGLSHLGYNALLRGDFAEAKNSYTESGAVFESIGPHKAGLAWGYFGLGEVGLAQKDAPSAINNLKMAVKFFSAYKSRLGIAWCLESLAGAISLNKQDELAARFWSMADAIHDSKDVRGAPIINDLHEKRRAKVRSRLGENSLKALRAQIQSISLEQAVNEVMAL